MSNIPFDDFDEDAIFGGGPAQASAPFAHVPSSFPANGNPLAGHFRIAGLTVSIPTGGAFLPKGTYFPNDDGSFDILPMRGSDELLMSSPDALMSNRAVVELLRSCVPQIKRPELISTPDLDVLLLAIKAASSGEVMKLDMTCPECEEHTILDINITDVLATMTSVDPSNMVRLGNEMVAEVVPYTIAIQTKMILDAYRVTRMSQAFDANSEMTEEDRAKEASRLLAMINDINMFGIKQSVKRIVIPGAEVTNRDHINEFFDNTDSNKTKAVRNKLDEINNKGVNRAIEVECGHCQHVWNTEIEFDPASFFANG